MGRAAPARRACVLCRRQLEKMVLTGGVRAAVREGERVGWAAAAGLFSVQWQPTFFFVPFSFLFCFSLL